MPSSAVVPAFAVRSFLQPAVARTLGLHNGLGFIANSKDFFSSGKKFATGILLRRKFFVQEKILLVTRAARDIGDFLLLKIFFVKKKFYQ